MKNQEMQASCDTSSSTAFYVVERTFLGKYSVAEFLKKVIKSHILTNTESI